MGDTMQCGKLLCSIYKELRSVDQLTDRQLTVQNLSWDDDKSVYQLRVLIRPNGGPYGGGQYLFQISIGPNFPYDGPDVTCLDKVYHPNIDPTESENNICLSLLSDWQSTNGLDDVIQGLLFLFHNPNLSDPYSPYFDVDMDQNDFIECVRLTMRGANLDGFCYGRTLIANDGPSDSGISDASTASHVCV